MIFSKNAGVEKNINIYKLKKEVIAIFQSFS